MLSWLKNLIQKITGKIQPMVEAEQELEVTTIEEPCLHDDLDMVMLRLQHAMAVNNHRAFDIERLEVLCNNIEVYIQLLRDVEDALNGDIPFPKEELSLRLVKVCNFYKNEKGQFVNIPEKRSLMIGRMLRVIKAYRAAKAIANPPGWLTYTLSRSVTAIVNIDSLSTQLASPRLGAE